MTLTTPRVRHYLQTFNLEKLFIEELGWDRYISQLLVQVNGQTYTLRALAEKRGVQIFEYQPDGDGKIPDYDTRRKIEKQVTRSLSDLLRHAVIYRHELVFILEQ